MIKMASIAAAQFAQTPEGRETIKSGVSFLFGLFILILFICFQHKRAKSSILTLSQINIEDVEKIVNNGDIISILHRGIQGVIVKTLSGCPLAHVGLIYKADGQVYILEMSN